MRRKPSALVEECQSIALAQAGDLSLAHHNLNRRGLKLQTVGDDRCVDVHGESRLRMDRDLSAPIDMDPRSVKKNQASKQENPGKN